MNLLIDEMREYKLRWFGHFVKRDELETLSGDRKM